MKKLLFTVIALISFSTVSEAKTESEVLASLSDQTRFDRLAKYVSADREQKKALKTILLSTIDKINASEGDEDVQKKAVYFNLANAKAVLSVSQYRMYLTILNATLNNNSESTPLYVEK